MALSGRLVVSVGRVEGLLGDSNWDVDREVDVAVGFVSCVRSEWGLDGVAGVRTRRWFNINWSEATVLVVLKLVASGTSDCTWVA